MTYRSMFSVVTVIHVGRNGHGSTTPPLCSFFALLGEACQSGAAVYRQRRRCFRVEVCRHEPSTNGEKSRVIDAASSGGAT